MGSPSPGQKLCVTLQAEAVADFPYRTSRAGLRGCSSPALMNTVSRSLGRVAGMSTGLSGHPRLRVHYRCNPGVSVQRSFHHQNLKAVLSFDRNHLVTFSLTFFSVLVLDPKFIKQQKMYLGGVLVLK